MSRIPAGNKVFVIVSVEDLHIDESYQRSVPLMMKVIQSHAAAFRKRFKLAADACFIKYPVSTHSLRKSFGFWSVKLHSYDVAIADKLQGIFSHSNCNTALHYIGISREDEKKSVIKNK